MTTTETGVAPTGRRKYDIATLEAEIARPKGKGGRPRKYNTEEERRAARIEYDRRRRARKRNERDGIENDETLALRRAARFASDEERRAAHVRRTTLYNARHPEMHRIYVASSHYRTHST
jgi:hypothetical protein